MSPNLKRPRKILNPPLVKGFKPYGPALSQGRDAIMMHFEEYEALRLCDYDMLNHHDASQEMGVSRPTFTRIYASARKKIARAFVEGKQITLEGGKVYFDSDWYHCLDCGCYFNHPEMHLPVSHCPLCGHQGFTRAIPDSLVETTEDSAGDYCICPGCGKEIEHIPGIPFNAEYCPDCQTRMRRKGNPS